MPRTLFDQVLVSAPKRRTPRWMKAVSLGLHLVAVVSIMVLPITAAFDLPGVYTRLPTVMLASVPTMPAAPPPPRTTSAPAATAVQTVPLAPPDGVHEEIERPPAVTTPGPPGSLPVSGSGGLLPVSVNNSTLTIKPPESVQPEPLRRVGGAIKPPERTHYKAPSYPPAAQAARIEGTVILEATIDAQGVVQNVTVLRSVPLLDRAAIEAVQQWRYSPTRLNGTPIPILMSITVTFSLR